MRNAFRRRFYRGPKDLLSDLRTVLAGRRDVRRLMRGESLAPAFRERLMLAVTAVNGCRYCLYGHTRMALVAGVSGEQVQKLCAGLVDDCPPEEATALLYAQHWADSDGKPAPQARARLRQVYGADKARSTEVSLQVIRVGNLAGNTLDYVLWRLSFGRWNVEQPLRLDGARAQRSVAGGEI